MAPSLFLEHGLDLRLLPPLRFILVACGITDRPCEKKRYGDLMALLQRGINVMQDYTNSFKHPVLHDDGLDALRARWTPEKTSNGKRRRLKHKEDTG